MIQNERIAHLLEGWAQHAEQFWYDVPDQTGLGCYGTGYNAWGVQTNQKYASAMAVLGMLGSGAKHKAATERALAALRFSLHSHVSGRGSCTDGTQWGHTWISALGIERMMHGVYLLDAQMTDEDRDALCRVLTSECDWIASDFRRGQYSGVVADRWNQSGKNAPESNLWNGAVLWRTASTYPDHPHADEWREQAHRFLVNAVSIPSDATNQDVVAGRTVAKRFVGANFFPNYALDHHGYLNVGYMVVCLSNAAMLHFDMRARGLPAPESLYHHLADLWSVVRHFCFENGRLCRIGGDSRLRYTYCQEYLLPSLLLVADQFGDPYALDLVAQQLSWIECEARYNEQGPAEHRGSFYGRRIAPLREQSPYYYTRLESDRACALGMALEYADLVSTSKHQQKTETAPWGVWCEPQHGAALVRSSSRLASFSWRAHGLAQGMCQPPSDGHLAEWSYNLAGVVRFLGDSGVISGGQTQHRDLVTYHIASFPGGFATCGIIAEGMDVRLAEGWQGTQSAEHQIAFVALPDDHTVVGLQRCVTSPWRTYLSAIKGMHLNVPNDVFNGFQRSLFTNQGQLDLQSPVDQSQIVDLGSLWANIEDQVGVVGLYGAPSLSLCRSDGRRGGKYASLYVDELCMGCTLETRSIDPSTVVLDVGWAVLSGIDVVHTQAFAANARVVRSDKDMLRTVFVLGQDGRRYVVAMNLNGAQSSTLLREQLVVGDCCAFHDLVTGVDYEQGVDIEILPAQVAVFVLV